MLKEILLSLGLTGASGALLYRRALNKISRPTLRHVTGVQFTNENMTLEQEFLHREREASLYEMLHKGDWQRRVAENPSLSEQDREEAKMEYEKARVRYDEVVERTQAQLVKDKVSAWERFRGRSKGEVYELRRKRAADVGKDE